MIVSVSRRTDIPAFFSGWFESRLSEGFAIARNPFNPTQRRLVELKPSAVEAVVFWTKNARPMLDLYEKGLREFCHYYLYTINGYGSGIETKVPQTDYSLETIRLLHNKGLARDEIVWRYDPVFFTESLTPKWHRENFRCLAQGLEGLTETCVLSFIDSYASILGRTSDLQDQLQMYNMDLLLEWMDSLAGIARRYGILVQTCSELVDFAQIDIHSGACIDGERIAVIRKRRKLAETESACAAAKDKNQRMECRCLSSVDIGAYGTCGHGCLYCYARGKKTAFSQNVLSPVLGEHA